MFRTEPVSSCDQRIRQPQKPKIFIDFRARDQIYKENSCSWEFKHFSGSKVGAAAAVLWKTWYILSQNVLQARISGFEALKKSSTRFVEGQIWTHPSAWAAPGRSEVRGPAEPAVGAQALLRGGGSWGSKFLHSDMWKPCVHISAVVAVPWGAAWLRLSVPASWIPTSASWLRYPEPGECRLIRPPPGPFRAVCGLLSPWNLPAFESQTIDKLEWLFPAQWGFGQGWASALGSHTPPFPAFPRRRLTQKRAEKFCYLVLPLFMYLQGKQRKCLLMPGKKNYFKMKGVYC